MLKSGRRFTSKRFVALALCGATTLVIALFVSRNSSRIHEWQFVFHPASWHMGKSVFNLPGADQFVTEYVLGPFTVSLVSRPVFHILGTNVLAPGLVLYNQLTEWELGKVLAVQQHSFEAGPATAVLLSGHRGEEWIRLERLTNALVRR